MYKTKLSIITAIALLQGCGGDTEKSETPQNEFETKEDLGRSLFFDKNISFLRKTSCATCHDPEKAFVDARFQDENADQNVFVHGALSVGDDGFSLGGRNSPTASYAKFSPDFHKQEDGTYKGGQFWDGRAIDLKGQAIGPPLDGAEMQMPDIASVIERIQENEKYVNSFEALYGGDIFVDVNKTYHAMGEAIAKFEKTEEFAPFDSKYDRSKLPKDDPNYYEMTMEEDLGYSLFFGGLGTENANTSCATCHLINENVESENELFTNFEYHNIGTPRNIEAMNRRFEQGFQTEYFKFLGLAGTVKNSDENWEEHLGKVKVPTLRNVAVTAPYMSNGVFKSLRTVLEFYDHMGGSGNRPNNPETGKPWGKTDFNQTVNFEDLSQNELTDTKIEALEAFLRLLTDKKYEHLLPEMN
jgi:cytochrome c peroxidase